MVDALPTAVEWAVDWDALDAEAGEVPCAEPLVGPFVAAEVSLSDGVVETACDVRGLPGEIAGVACKGLFEVVAEFLDAAGEAGVDEGDAVRSLEVDCSVNSFFGIHIFAFGFVCWRGWFLVGGGPSRRSSRSLSE